MQRTFREGDIPLSLPLQGQQQMARSSSIPKTLAAILEACEKLPCQEPEPDACTVIGSRSHANEALEAYVRRLERLEEIAQGFDGVEKVFALQAGREVRVVVDPGTIDDLASKDLARRIARKLEEDLQYPGQIEITVIREFRAKDYAR